MIQFILNNESIQTDLPPGMTALDFIRYRRALKGTKIGCREGDCGACTILVGAVENGRLTYRSMTSCLMPLANAQGKHLVTVEGVNGEDLSPVQAAMVAENGAQCGFCTIGFVMSFTGAALQGGVVDFDAVRTAADGNICRCTGYKSIERAARRIAEVLQERGEEEALPFAVEKGFIPGYFKDIAGRLAALQAEKNAQTIAAQAVLVGGGTDLYVQKHDRMTEAPATHLFDRDGLNGVRLRDGWVEIGAAATVSDLQASPEMNALFPRLQQHLRLVSSTPIRNMATVGGNLVNASPIGDLTIFLLALDAQVVLEGAQGDLRELPLRRLYLGYKKLDMQAGETLIAIRFPAPDPGVSRFNFEKVCKRTYLDIASVNTAIALKMDGNTIGEARVAMGGVAPVPLHLPETSAFLKGKQLDSEAWIPQAIDILQSEIAPISDVRGTSDYKRLLASQLFKAHFYEMFPSA